MNEVAELSLVETILVSVLLLVGAAFTLIGTIGLVRLPNFYARVHAPTLGTTLGTLSIAVASMIYFSITGTRLTVHELVAVVLVTVSTPVGLIILVRAALFRESFERDQAGPPSDRR